MSSSTPSAPSDFTTDPTAKTTTAGLNDRFFRYFQHEVTAIQDQISQLVSTSSSGSKHTDAVDGCLAGIARLSHEVKDASSYLPRYDQKQYADAVKALSAKLQETRDSFAPKSKFSFKSTLKTRSPPPITNVSSANPSALLNVSSPINSTAAKVDPAIEAANKKIREDTSNIRRTSFGSASSISLSNHENAYIIVQPSASSAASGSGMVNDIDNSVIDLHRPTYGGSPFPGLTVRNVSSSLLLCGKVSSAIHMTNLKDCVLVVATRQFRMHECENVTVYLHCSSRPIIEDCSGVRFAPLPEAYIDDMLRETKNQWDQIDDFRWLKAEPSPNWSILPQIERLSDDFWSRTLDGGASLSTVDVMLKSAGVDK